MKTSLAVPRANTWARVPSLTTQQGLGSAFTSVHIQHLTILFTSVCLLDPSHHYLLPGLLQDLTTLSSHFYPCYLAYHQWHSSQRDPFRTYVSSFTLVLHIPLASHLTNMGESSPQSTKAPCEVAPPMSLLFLPPSLSCSL